MFVLRKFLLRRLVGVGIHPFFKNGLATKEQWFQYNNPDYSPDDLKAFQELQAQQQEETPQNRLLSRLQNGNN